MLMVIAGAVAISVFCLVATKAIIVKGAYQRRALHARNQVVDQLKANVQAANSLFTQYQVFAQGNPNILGGFPGGSGNLDGDNPRIVLDSLPSTYDSPALATSLEKVMVGRGVTINSIDVKDDPITNSDAPQAEPKYKTIQFSFKATADYQKAKQLMLDFERSIRPFDLNKMQIQGSDNSLKLDVTMTTEFQPAKSLDLKPTKVVQ